ncbi:MAG: LacI family DNA-binding transcriptional regulator [Chakrabartia sp.]
MTVTIEDVSRAAGVSIKTVSRVVNREKYVAQATREKVERAIEALGFRPNFAARALAGHRSFQIALIYDNPSPYNAQNIQAGVRARCTEGNYRMIAQPSDADSPTVLSEICGLIDQAQLDGIILTPPFTDRSDIVAELKHRNIPYVMISPAVRDPATSCAYIDNAQAAEDMTSHLIALGHLRIGFVEGHPHYATSAQRLDGYRRALTVAAISYDADLVQPGLYNFASGSTAAEALLDLADPPTAIFASSDDMAAGVLATAHRLGKSLPRQLSVTGFDDTDLAPIIWPPLTTIHQPVRELGYAAADLLFQLPDKIEHRELPYGVVIRGSTAGHS